MINKFKIKNTPDSRALLNLGCGTITDQSWNNLDFSPYAFLKRHKTITTFVSKVGLLSKERQQKLKVLDPEVIYWNLKRGIPFADQQFDTIYMANVLEHFKLDTAIIILKECHRTLKTGSVLRIVIPDLEKLVNNYTSTLKDARSNPEKSRKHLLSIANVFEQITRDEPHGIKHQLGLSRAIERLLRKNARQAGEAHRWMFDEISLTYYLKNIGFKNIGVKNFEKSDIHGFSRFELDSRAEPSIRRLSLYIEAIKK